MSPRISVVLENIRSAFNVGSVFRSCESAGVDHLYLTGYTATPENPKVLKTALFSHESVSWSHHKDTMAVVESLIEAGNTVIAFETTKDAVSMYDYHFPDKSAIIFGNEVNGISPEILSLAKETVKIPMFGKKESLNIAVAAGIGIYEVKRQLVYEK